MNDVIKRILEEILDTNVSAFIEKVTALSSNEIVQLLSDNVVSDIFSITPDGEGGLLIKIKLDKDQVKALLLELYKQL